MNQVTFIRATHENGRFRPYPTEAYQFWQDHGWLVGEVLRPETGMAFSELIEACMELIQEHPEAGLFEVDERYLAWCLVQLLELGMASTIKETEG